MTRAMLALVCALLGPTSPLGPSLGTTVDSVELVAPRGLDAKELEPLVLVRAGQPYSVALVSRTVELLYESGKVQNVYVYRRPAPHGTELVFRLIPKQRLTWIGFHGNQSLSREALRRASGLEVGDEVVVEKLRAALQRIVAAYRRKGYPAAQLRPQLTEGMTEVALDVEVDEGPPEIVREVSLEGDLGEARSKDLAVLEERGGLRTGAVLDRDALVDGARRLELWLRRRGFDRARVGPPSVVDRPDGRADVRLPVQAGPRISFAFSGNLSFESEELEAALAYDPTERLDDLALARLSERIRVFYLSRGFLEAHVRLESEGGHQRRAAPGLLVERFVVNEGRPVSALDVRVLGVHHLDAADLERVVRAIVTGGDETPLLGRPEDAAVDSIGPSGRPLEGDVQRFRAPHPGYVPEALEAAAEEIARRYQEGGWLDVQIPPPSLDLDEATGRALISFVVKEGQRTFVREIRFEGVASLSEARALQIVALRPGDSFSRSEIDRARARLQNAYARSGRPFARVDVESGSSRGAGRVVFVAEEGPLARIGQLLVRGNRHTSEGVVRRALALEPGELLDPEALEHAQQRIAGLGVFDSVQVAMVDPSQPDEVKDVVVSVHERKPEGIVVGGGYSIVEGPRAFVEYTHTNLFGRGLHFQSELKLNYFPLSYLALSGPSGSLVLEGLPPAQTLAGKDNFFGFGGRLNAVLSEPRAFDLFSGDGSMRGEALVERIDRPYYAFSRGALVPGLEWRYGRRLSVAIQLQGEWDQILTYWENLDQIYQYLSFADLENLRFPDGWGLLASVGPTISWDQRDDPINPRHGVLASLRGNAVGGVFFPSSQGGQILELGGTCATPGAPCSVELFSAQGLVAGYVPLGPRFTLALSAKAGRIFPAAGSFVIPTQRFFLGGPDADRGFQQDMMLPQDVRESLHQDVALCNRTAGGLGCTTAAQLLRTPANQLPSPGGEVFDLVRGELRFPLYDESIDGAVFVDAGNLWANPAAFDPLLLRPAAGVGVRVPSPIGPAAFDLGFNLDPDTTVNETIVQIHLAIGLF